MMRRREALIALALVTGCNQRDQVALKYQLAIDPQVVALVETQVAVDPADMRLFFADQPFRTVAMGVGYEVITVGDGKRVMKITQEAALGFQFTPEFVFTLLPPADGMPPPLMITAQALGTTRNVLGETAPLPASFGKGTELVVEIEDQRCGGEACADDEACCAGACTQVLMDAKHCGTCGKACGTNETCSGGLCRCAGGSTCGAGKSCCEAGCIDTQTDAFNCGACGKTCRPGETCVAGACRCNGGAACGPNDFCCAGSNCTSGGCACGGTTCTPQMPLCCGNTCVDHLTSNQHCGACNTPCGPTPLSCSGGLCRCGTSVCAPGDTCCAGAAAGPACANLQNDPKHCGVCGKSCRPNETCQGGQCRCGGSGGCGDDQICCGSSCKSFKTDPQNCGACGNMCGSNETCVNGQCKCFGNPRCIGNQKCCPDVMMCVDVSSDPAHCGACDKSCTNGDSCVMGMCMPTPCPPMCMLNGNQCTGGMCQCNGGAPCTGGKFCCSSGCTDRLTDPNNCGQCDRKCGVNQLCCNGTCEDRGPRHCVTCNDMCINCCVCGAQTICAGLGEPCLACGGSGGF